MTWWGWVLLSGIAVLFVLASSTVSFQVYYSRVKDNDRFYIFIKGIFGLVRYRYEVPLIKFKGLQKGILVKEEHVNESGDRLIAEDSQQIDKEKVLNYYRKAKEMLQYTFQMKDWFLDTLTKVTCTELTWSTRIGLGDAPETAITTGIIWTLKSSALTYLFQHIKRCTKPRIQVIPHYAQAHFSTEVSCIAKIRLGHAMLAGLLLAIRILKVKGGIKAWQSILFKAS
jgi:hypothetical protein